jgi:hypothetical protein
MCIFLKVSKYKAVPDVNSVVTVDIVATAAGFSGGCLCGVVDVTLV